MPNLADVFGSLPAWLQVIVGTGLVGFIGKAALTQVNKLRAGRQAVKEAPVLKEQSDLAALQLKQQADHDATMAVLTEHGTAIERFTLWLEGGQDYWGNPKRDGFMFTYPKDQEAIVGKLDQLITQSNGEK